MELLKVDYQAVFNGLGSYQARIGVAKKLLSLGHPIPHEILDHIAQEALDDRNSGAAAELYQRLGDPRAIDFYSEAGNHMAAGDAALGMGRTPRAIFEYLQSGQDGASKIREVVKKAIEKAPDKEAAKKMMADIPVQVLAVAGEKYEAREIGKLVGITDPDFWVDVREYERALDMARAHWSPPLAYAFLQELRRQYSYSPPEYVAVDIAERLATFPDQKREAAKLLMDIGSSGSLKKAGELYQELGDTEKATTALAQAYVRTENFHRPNVLKDLESIAGQAGARQAVYRVCEARGSWGLLFDFAFGDGDIDTAERAASQTEAREHKELVLKARERWEEAVDYMFEYDPDDAIALAETHLQPPEVAAYRWRYIKHLTENSTFDRALELATTYGFDDLKLEALEASGDVSAAADFAEQVADRLTEPAKRGMLQKAEQLWRSHMHEHKSLRSTPEERRHLGDIAEKTGDMEAARLHRFRRAELLGDPLESGRQLYELGLRHQAMEELGKTPTHYSYVDAAYQLAEWGEVKKGLELLERLGDFRTAQILAEKAAETDPTFSERAIYYKDVLRVLHTDLRIPTD